MRKNAFYATKHLLEKAILDRPQIMDKFCPAIVRLSNVPLRNHDVDFYTNSIEVSSFDLKMFCDATDTFGVLFKRKTKYFER